VKVQQALFQTYEGGPFDVVVCAETLEHMVNTQEMVDRLESWCYEGGTVILTVPVGPWEAMSFHEPQKVYVRDHCHHFTYWDLIDLFGKKKGVKVDIAVSGVTDHGELLGNWIVSWTVERKRPTGQVDYDRKMLITRPYQSISACMIVKNEEDHILA